MIANIFYKNIQRDIPKIKNIHHIEIKRHSENKITRK